MEHELDLHRLVHACSSGIGLSLNNEQVKRFVAYLWHLKTWNQTFNLTGITSDEEIVIKHFVDSFAVLNAVEMRSGSRLLDVGTGAGFPGVPLKIVRPDLRITLVEPASKKTSFLRFLVGTFQLEDMEIFEGTLDQFVSQSRGTDSYDYITTRALKLNLILQSGSKLLHPGGAAIFYSSRSMSGLDFLKPWRLLNDYSFDLPKRLGRRHISIFSPSP
ncbi:MAG: 16S rRNA (guanine(527)-N(7))-methyltransferase RsmG [Nitrospira sp.]|nr:16S rRNA (guanine(527)-N(7))-methyltransferase RsmG [Nitrospira sp.]